MVCQPLNVATRFLECVWRGYGLTAIIVFQSLLSVPSFSQETQPRTEEERGLSGRVMVEQSILAGAQLPTGIWVIAVGAKAGNVVSARTDAEGRFLFRPIPEDRYRIWVEHTLFGRRPYKSQGATAPQDVIAIDSATPVRSIDIHVRRGLVIAGRVEDANRKPVAGASVYALRRTFSAQGWSPVVFAGAVSGKDGAYRFEPIEPEGPLYLAAVIRNPGSSSAAILGTRDPDATMFHRSYRLVFYPNADRFADAAPVFTGTPGSELVADLRFSLGDPANHEIIVNTGAADQTNMEATVAVPGLGMATPYFRHTAAVKPTGQPGQLSFTFAGLTQEEYILTLEAKGRATAKADPVLLRQAVTFKKDDLPQVLTLPSPATLTGDLSLDTVNKDAPRQTFESNSIRLYLEPELLDGKPFVPITPLPQGELRSPTFPPGRYYLRTSGMPEDIRVSAIALSGKAYPSSAVLDLLGPVHLKVGLARFGAVIQGKLEKAEPPDRSSPAGSMPPVTVVAIPDSREYDEFLTVQADAEGRFSFTGVKPGRYLVAAVEQMERNAHKSPSFAQKVSAAGVYADVKPDTILDVKLKPQGTVFVP